MLGRGARVLSFEVPRVRRRSPLGADGPEGVIGPEGGPSLVGPRRRALEVTLLLVEAAPAPLDERAVALAVLDVFRLLTRDVALVIAIDDVQWLDASRGGWKTRRARLSRQHGARFPRSPKLGLVKFLVK